MEPAAAFAGQEDIAAVDWEESARWLSVPLRDEEQLGFEAEPVP